MAGKIRKHSGKIFIFIINLFLMTIAVFVIKDKDQARRSSETQKNLLDENSILKVELQSLKGVLNEINSALSVEEANISVDEKSQPAASESSTVITPSVGTGNTTPTVSSPATPSPAISSPPVSAPVPSQNTAPANTKTKTS
jgi:hypothetical protein